MKETENKRQDMQWASRQLNQVWEDGWARENYIPGWQILDIPPSVRAVVEEGWFPRGASILDVGCGGGEIAAWLTDQGYRVLGIDCAPSAIARAEQQFGNRGDSLSFRVFDICRDKPDEDKYDVILDRGCLHGLPAAFHADYLRTVLQWSAPEAPFLLICGTNQGSPRSAEEEEKLKEKRITGLREIFEKDFEILNIHATRITRREPLEDIPGLIVRMLRRGNKTDA